MMIADYSTRLRRPAHNPGNVPQESTAAIAAIARDPRGTYRAKFRGARFGHGLYNGYFAQKMTVDPEGNKVSNCDDCPSEMEDLLGLALNNVGWHISTKLAFFQKNHLNGIYGGDLMLLNINRRWRKLTGMLPCKFKKPAWYGAANGLEKWNWWKSRFIQAMQSMKKDIEKGIGFECESNCWGDKQGYVNPMTFVIGDSRFWMDIHICLNFFKQKGQYPPSLDELQRLITHELTHLSLESTHGELTNKTLGNAYWWEGVYGAPDFDFFIHDLFQKNFLDCS